MNLAETDRLLTLIANVDNRKVDDATVLVWYEIIGSLPFDDCLMAMTRHFGQSDDYLMPVHIARGAAEVARQRVREERERAAIEQAPETDPRPLTDRSAEIRAFVQGVRDVLPPGDPAKLRPRTAYWARVKEERERQDQAEANPHYDPTAIARIAVLNQTTPEDTP